VNCPRCGADMACCDQMVPTWCPACGWQSPAHRELAAINDNLKDILRRLLSAVSGPMPDYESFDSVQKRVATAIRDAEEALK
jgi:hypothetical protein